MLCAATVYVAWTNASGTRVLVFPLLDHLFADPHVQGHVSLGILALLTVISAALALRRPTEASQDS